MHAIEYYKAERKLEPQRKKLKGLKQNGQEFQKELSKLIELTITVFGHAWCMDVKSERRKMVRLISQVF